MPRPNRWNDVVEAAAKAFAKNGFASTTSFHRLGLGICYLPVVRVTIGPCGGGDAPAFRDQTVVMLRFNEALGIDSRWR